MIDLKLYLISYDQCSQKAIENLTKKERDRLVCYAVGAGKLKNITAKINIINEWQLPWYESRYQFLQYYEYSFLPHFLKNPILHENLTHVGMLHNDVLFHKGAVNDMIKRFNEQPDTIFYVSMRKSDVLYFTEEQLMGIIGYMEPKLGVKIDPNKVCNDGWVSESMTVAPKEVFVKFSEYLRRYQYEIENMLNNNKWGLMNVIKHRVCGIIERMWGMYLVSCGMNLERMPIDHDRDSYAHQHLIDKEKHLKNF